MASGKSTIKPSKKSTAMHYSIKCLLPHMYGYAVVPLPSIEKKKEKIYGLGFHIFLLLVKEKMCVLDKIVQTTDSRVSEEFQAGIMTAAVVKKCEIIIITMFSLLSIPLTVRLFKNISLI